MAGADGGRVVGVGIALRRGPIWVLSQLSVRPEAHGTGLGRDLLRRTLEYGEGCRGFMLCASTHPAALHLYAAHGFRLEPSLAATGTVDRTRLPAVPGIREGGLDDLEICAAVDDAVRGAARNVDIAGLLDRGTVLLVSDRPRGYALVDEGRCFGLAAEDEDTARKLLWALLAATPDGGSVEVEWITAPQQWAIEVAVQARLRLEPDGPVCVRGETGPRHPWLPNGALL